MSAIFFIGMQVKEGMINLLDRVEDYTIKQFLHYFLYHICCY